MPTKNDYFYIETEQLLITTYKELVKIIKFYAVDINVYQVEDKIVFSIKNIINFKDYFKDICNFAYYNNCTNLTEKEFNKLVSDYDLNNDLINDEYIKGVN